MKHKTWSSNHPIQHPHPHAPNYHRLFFISPLPPLSFLSSSPPFPIPITSFPTFLAFLPHFLYSLFILPLQNHHPLVLAIHSLFTPSTPFTSPLPPPPLTSCSRLTASCSSNLSQLFSMVPPAPQNPRGYEKAVSHLFEDHCVRWKTWQGILFYIFFVKWSGGVLFWFWVSCSLCEEHHWSNIIHKSFLVNSKHSKYVHVISWQFLMVLFSYLESS